MRQTMATAAGRLREAGWGRRRVLALATFPAWLALAGPLGMSADAQGPIRFPTGELAIVTDGGEVHEFTVELARTREQHRRGLMYRREMAADHGMLFIYGRTQPVAMWMKNTFIPLDMLFIKPDGRIVRIAERTVPQSTQAIPSGEPVRAVLELRGGTADRLGIEVGDRVRHPVFETSS